MSSPSKMPEPILTAQDHTTEAYYFLSTSSPYYPTAKSIADEEEKKKYVIKHGDSEKERTVPVASERRPEYGMNTVRSEGYGGLGRRIAGGGGRAI